MRQLILGAVLFVAAGIAMGAGSFENTRWNLTELRGEAVKLDNEKQRPHLTLSTLNQQVSGFGGCNSFQGTYKIEGEHVRFQNMIATLRACADQTMNDREREFMAVLDAATSYKVKDDSLELSGDGKVLARFSAKE